MAVVLALSAALTYGLSDFVGGVASKRAGPWTLALVAQVTGAVGVLALGLLLGGDPAVGDLGWALLAGLGNGVGTAFLYRGLSGGRMGVVAPVSGVGTALLPVLVGVATGERPSALVWVGVAVALPAIWLVAREADDGAGTPDVVDRAAEAPPARGSGLLDGVLAGLGFGTLFVGLSRIPESSGLVPLGVNQAVGAVVVLAVALALRQRPFVASRAAALGMVSGVLGTSATVAFVAATHQGLLTVSAVITALYPAGTVVLAALVLKERVHRVQGVGLALAGAAVVLVAAG